MAAGAATAAACACSNRRQEALAAGLALCHSAVSLGGALLTGLANPSVARCAFVADTSKAAVQHKPKLLSGQPARKQCSLGKLSLLPDSDLDLIQASPSRCEAEREATETLRFQAQQAGLQGLDRVLLPGGWYL